MSRSLASVKINVTMSAQLQNTLDDGEVATVTHPDLNYAPAITNGIHAGQADRAWQVADVTLSENSSVTINLYDFSGIDLGAGSGNDGLGQAVINEEIVAIAILNNNAVSEAGVLEIEPGASNPFEAIGSHTAANGGALPAQGLLLKVQPADDAFRVEDGVKQNIKLTAKQGDVKYCIYVLFRHDWEESSSSSSSTSSSSSSSSLSASSSSVSASSSSQSSQSSSSSSSSSVSASSSSVVEGM